jgi:adenine-specific DNA-methyltransferase
VLAALLYSASYVSNTSGVFKGFHRGWGGATGTALYRILSDLRLSPPITRDNGRVNRVTALDAQTLAENLAELAPGCDVAYLDPPYNQHPYGSNYHVLNTIALGDCPPVGESIRGRGDKSAIRRDWRTARRSAYNYRHGAPGALGKLLGTIACRSIVLSYSTDGLIPLQSVVELAGQRGAVTALPRRYKRYRVSAQRYSPRSATVEYCLVIDTQKPSHASQTDELVETILGAGERPEEHDGNPDRGELPSE